MTTTDAQPPVEAATPDRGISILPFYLVADVSSSMAGTKIAALNRLLPELRDELKRNPVVGDLVRVGMLAFSTNAHVVLPSTDLRLIDDLPTLTTNGSTNYGEALSLLKRQIEDDYALFRADGLEVKRATAVFLTDGGPTDREAEWKAAFDALTVHDAEARTGFRLFPNLIPVGIGVADRAVLTSIRFRKEGDAAMPALFTESGADPARAIAELIPVLIRSIVSSSLASAGASGQGEAAKAMAAELEAAPGFDMELD